jgi:hypothetical protein
MRLMRGTTSSVRLGAVALLAAAGLGLSGCGSSASDDYAAGWNGICRDVGGAYKTFRSDVSTAAGQSPDAGDATVSAGLSRTAVAADLAKPTRKLERALQAPLARAAALHPPAEWSAWHAGAVRALAAQDRVITAGGQRLQAGDPDAIDAIALGGIGPASVSAPAALRDLTPDCTALQ